MQSVLDPEEPRDFHAERLGECNQLEIQNTTNAGFNLCDACPVNGNTLLSELLGNVFLREWRLRFAARLLHALTYKVL